MNKYHNKKCVYLGETFDSRKEARRYAELLLLEKAGHISDLRRQVSYELIPAQREVSSDVYKRGARKGKTKEGKIIEKAVRYVADFVYIDNATGEEVVEDVKGGVRTKEYVLKRKMMLFLKGIRITEY
jgi:hypothetical protein